MYCTRTTSFLLDELSEDLRRAGQLVVRQVWPDRPPRELPKEVPGLVRSLYKEASVSENADALRAAAGLYRATVEALLDDRKVPAGRLQPRIDQLATQGVDPDLVRDLHEARLLGNWSLHQGVEFTAEEVGDVAMLIRDAVEVLYVQPKKREAMRLAREERRRGSGSNAS
jgi:hypothetical protein